MAAAAGAAVGLVLGGRRGAPPPRAADGKVADVLSREATPGAPPIEVEKLRRFHEKLHGAVRELREERARGRELQRRLDERRGVPAGAPPPQFSEGPETFDISDPQMLAPVSVVPTSVPRMMRIISEEAIPADGEDLPVPVRERQHSLYG